MLAVVDGEAVAAMSLSDLRIVANPFVRTQHAVKLLRLRAAHLSDRRERPPPAPAASSALRRLSPSLRVGAQAARAAGASARPWFSSAWGRAPA